MSALPEGTREGAKSNHYGIGGIMGKKSLISENWGFTVSESFFLRAERPLSWIYDYKQVVNVADSASIPTPQSRENRQ